MATDDPAAGRAHSARSWPQPTSLVLLCLLCGVCSGLLETSTVYAAYRAGQVNLYELSSHAFWMAAWFHVGLFFAVGLLWAVASVPFRRVDWFRPVMVSCGTLGMYLQLSLLAELWHSLSVHPLARVVLAFGIALRFQPVFEARRDALRGSLRRLCAFSVLIPLTLTGAILGGRWWIERQGVAALPTAPARAPNVLLIVVDTVRAKSLGLYGGPQPTSRNLSAWAERGVSFEHALAPSPWTLPSHASMFTGLPAHRLQASWFTPLGLSPPTLAEAFRDAGYLTGAFMGNNRYCGRYTGLDRGFLRYSDCAISLGEWGYAASPTRALAQHRLAREQFGVVDMLGRRAAPEVTREFLDWVDRRGERPYFAVINYFDAHEPYLPPAGYNSSAPWTAEQTRIMADWHAASVWQPDPVSPRRMASAQLAYEDCVRYLDEHIHTLLCGLEERGSLHNTIVVITSDHGELFGEHQTAGHVYNLYRPALHVPLVVFGPGVPAQQHVQRLVTLVDLPATVLSLAGVNGSEIPGHSWVPLWTEPDPIQSDARVPFSAFARACPHPGLPLRNQCAGGDVQSVFFQSFQYTRELRDGGREFLFDFALDREESSNLVNDPEFATTAARARALCTQMFER